VSLRWRCRWRLGWRWNEKVDGEEKEEVMLVKVWDERGRKGRLDGDGEGEGGMSWWGEDAE